MSPRKTKHPLESGKDLLKELTRLTKAALYRIAQKLMIPGRSGMTKSELVRVLGKKQEEVASLLKRGFEKKRDTSEETSAISTASEEDSIKKKLEGQKGQTSTLEIPKEKREVHSTQVQSSRQAKAAPSAPPPAQEPASVWVGEEGPELPRSYNHTVLRAIPRDPHWVYVYWEISEETRQAIVQEEGEWFFDITIPILRVYNEKEEILQEVPILLDAGNWYLALNPNQPYQFELGLKKDNGEFRPLARSKKIATPEAQPSEVTDEEWSIVDEKFEEILSVSGGIDTASSWGGSAEMPRHVLRHRVNAPWTKTLHDWVSPPSSHVLPSSHSMPSSHSTKKKES